MNSSETLENPRDPAPRRTWCYARPPRAFEMAPCSCGNHDTLWSEFEGHLWCEECQKDFVPEHAGVFDGPIPLQTATMLGLCFDRIDLASQALQRFDTKRLVYVDADGRDIEVLAACAPAQA